MRPAHWIPVIGIFLLIEDDLRLSEPTATYYSLYHTLWILLVLALFVGGGGFINFSLYPNL